MAGTSETYDYLLVGGGLQNGLIASALMARRPDVRIALIERDDVLGGDHLWSFHAGDVTPDAHALIDPFVAYRWPGYRVTFPRFARDLDEPYATATSTRFDPVMRERFDRARASTLLLGTAVRTVRPYEVTLEDGSTLRAKLVIDARGPGALPLGESVAFQKFLGLEVSVDPATCPERPTLIDATVSQREGFRFVYVLPFARDRLFVEDTYFSDTPGIDRETLRTRALEYLRSRGIAYGEIVREETGVLPLPWKLERPALQKGLLVAGYQGGWFHPATGYSFPVALRLACEIASRPPEAVGEGSEDPSWHRFTREHRRRLEFAMVLNRLLFTAYPPGERWRVFERFYKLPIATIRRFYALASTPMDAARIMANGSFEGMDLRSMLSG